MKDAKEQIQLIENMIDNTKVKIREGSVHYLLWGWLVVIGAVVNYTLLKNFNFQYHWFAWPILMCGGAIAAGIIGSKQEKRKRTKTFVDRVITNLWMGFVFSLLIILAGMLVIGPQKAYPMIIVLYGLGTFVSGGVLKFKPLQAGAIICWLLGLFAFFVSFDLQLIILAASVVVAYLIPGYLLSKSDQNV